MALAQRLSGEDDAETTPRDFAATVRRHQSMVYSIALHFLADRSAAEELAQDVFLQLHASLPTLKSAEHVTFWLRKVTSHRCIDYRRRRRLPEVSLDDAPEPAALDRSADPLLARKLRQLIASLPEKPRIVMVLRYQEEMTPEEIADLLTMPVATVKSHLQRSLLLLREKMLREKMLGEKTLPEKSDRVIGAASTRPVPEPDGEVTT
jgi:RNA polymerase sigma-70 factor, ECF subfamily